MSCYKTPVRYLQDIIMFSEKDSEFKSWSVNFSVAYTLDSIILIVTVFFYVLSFRLFSNF